MDAIEMLKKDHQNVRELVTRVHGGSGLTGLVKRLTGNGTPRARRSTAEKICRELDLHALVEEEVFYPAVRALRDDRLGELVGESLREHAKMKADIEKIRVAREDEDALESQMSELEQDVEHHVSEEEGEMFPRVEETMAEDEREELARRMRERKRAATGRRGGGRKRAARGRSASRARTAARRTRATGTKSRKQARATKKKARAGRRR
jgi:hemerythrin superfamily protein